MRLVFSAIVLGVLAGGCSLIIDLDSVRQKQDAAEPADFGNDRDRLTNDLPGEDRVGPGDAGLEDLGSADQGLSDFGRPLCPARNDAEVLGCNGPRIITSGSLGPISLASGPSQLVSAIGKGSNVEVRTHDLNGMVLSTETLTLPAPPQSLQLAAGTNTWALAAIAGGPEVFCFSNVPTSTAVRLPTNFPVDEVSIAMSPGGAVAWIAAEPNTINTEVHTATSAAGCPRTSHRWQPWYYTRGISAVHLTGGGEDAFRFGLTAIHPNLTHSSLLILDANEMRAVYAYTGLGIRALGSVSSGDGTLLFQTYGWFEAQGQVSLTTAVQRTDFSASNAPETFLTPDAEWFDMASCGPGCVATAFLSAEGSGRISIGFLTDDVRVQLKNGVVYDAVCDLIPFDAQVDAAGLSGGLALLYSAGTEAQLYLCPEPN